MIGLKKVQMAETQTRRSLRSVLFWWFIAISFVPLAFVTGYSLMKYEAALTMELNQRLLANGREVQSILTDYRNVLLDRREKYFRDLTIAYNLSIQKSNTLEALLKQRMEDDVISQVSLFDIYGRQVLIAKNINQEKLQFYDKDFSEAQNLTKDQISKFNEQQDQILSLDFSEEGLVRLSLISKVFHIGNHLVGYSRMYLDLKKDFVHSLKERMGLELAFLNPQSEIALATSLDMSMVPSTLWKNKKSFEWVSRGEPFGFIATPLKWGDEKLVLLVGASKMLANQTIRNVNYTFFAVVGLLMAVIFIVSMLTSNAVVKPINDLLEGIEKFQTYEVPLEIPVKTDSEIGLLTEKFNYATRKIVDVQMDLRKKIQELELANKDLKEAQQQLVQSAKMASLGQLVAGIAHELNNPIGFIYSNMIHLKEYAEKIIRFSKDVAEKPDQYSKLYQQYEIEFIEKDLPKLIRSCEEGSKRTRDIVLGLRKFSRIEEDIVKPIRLSESIQTSLSLLSGEIKNRIEIDCKFDFDPEVHCLPSEINQVFMNILTNAVQAIEGEGRIDISQQKTNLGNQPAICVQIKDSGPGITPENQQKIFDPFFTTKDVGSGTGLGLSITYGIVKKHQGLIQLHSELGKGTSFSVILPLESQIETSA